VTRFPSRATGLLMVPAHAVAGLWRSGLRALRRPSARGELAELSFETEPVGSVRRALALARGENAEFGREVDARLRAMSPDAVKRLVGALATSGADPGMGRDLNDALKRIGSEPALRGLIESGDRSARIAGLRGLKLSHDDSTALLSSAMSDEDSGVRQAAVEVAGRFGAAARRTEVPAALIDALADDDREVRWRAAKALGAVGGEGAAEALSSLASNDADDFVREQAKRAAALLA